MEVCWQMAWVLCTAAMAGEARIPELERHVVARQQVAPVPAEAQVGDAGDDLAEEAPRARRLLLAQIKYPVLGFNTYPLAGFAGQPLTVQRASVTAFNSHSLRNFAERAERPDLLCIHTIMPNSSETLQPCPAEIPVCY